MRLPRLRRPALDTDKRLDTSSLPEAQRDLLHEWVEGYMDNAEEAGDDLKQLATWTATNERLEAGYLTRNDLMDLLLLQGFALVAGETEAEEAAPYVSLYASLYGLLDKADQDETKHRVMGTLYAFLYGLLDKAGQDEAKRRAKEIRRRMDKLILAEQLAKCPSRVKTSPAPYIGHDRELRGPLPQGPRRR